MIKTRQTIASLVLLFFLAAAYFLLFTPGGASWMIRGFLSRVVSRRSYSIRRIEGSLWQQLSLHHVEIKDARGLPAGSILRIQKLDAYLTSPEVRGLNIEVHNARLILPNSDPIVIDGIFQEGTADFNIYSRRMDVKDLSFLRQPEGHLASVLGAIGNFDVLIKGPWQEWEATGGFHIERVAVKDFSVEDSPVYLNLKVRDINKDMKIAGEILFERGLASSPHTAIEIQASKIMFSGDPGRPSFDIAGTATIEGTKIKIGLKGDAEKPLLKLTSQPPLSEEKLLLMLATGKSWQGAEQALTQGQISADLVKDFLDYFLFGGSVGKLAGQLGISSISLQYDSAKRGVGLTKEITARAEVSYGIQQPQARNGERTAVTQKVGGAYKITDTLSIEGEKELRSEENIANQTQTTPAHDALFLRYKKSF